MPLNAICNLGILRRDFERPPGKFFTGSMIRPTVAAVVECLLDELPHLLSHFRRSLVVSCLMMLTQQRGSSRLPTLMV